MTFRHREETLNAQLAVLLSQFGVKADAETIHLAVGFDTPVLGNTWWALKSDELSPWHRKALLLWLNSSISLLMFFGLRVTTRSAWMQMKKPAWAATPTLDVRALTAPQITELANAYDRLSEVELLPLARLDVDSVRHEIDEAISSVMGFPPLSMMRQMLALEPGLTGDQVVSSGTDEDENDLEA